MGEKIKVKSCSNCKWMKQGIPFSAFKHSKPKTRKEKELFAEEINEHQKEKEQEKFDLINRMQFINKPKHNPWCTKFTLTEEEFKKAEESLALDGKLLIEGLENNQILKAGDRYLKIFVMTSYKNKDGNCQGYEE